MKNEIAETRNQRPKRPPVRVPNKLEAGADVVCRQFHNRLKGLQLIRAETGKKLACALGQFRKTVRGGHLINHGGPHAHSTEAVQAAPAQRPTTVRSILR